MEKSIPRITVCHHDACRVVTNDDCEGQVYPILTRIMDSFSCSPWKIAFSYFKRLLEALSEGNTYKGYNRVTLQKVALQMTRSRSIKIQVNYILMVGSRSCKVIGSTNLFEFSNFSDCYYRILIS